MVGGGRRVVIGSRLRAAAERVHRRFELQEVLIRGRLALVGIDQLTGGLDKPGDTLIATDRILLGHDTSLHHRLPVGGRQPGGRNQVPVQLAHRRPVERPGLVLDG